MNREHDAARRARGGSRSRHVKRAAGDRDLEVIREGIVHTNALTPVMSRPTMSVCIVSVPSKVWIDSMSTM